MSLYQLPLTKFSIYGCRKLPLDTVELICQHMTQLKDLDIGFLDITDLPSSLGGCKSLTSLDLRACESLTGTT